MTPEQILKALECCTRLGCSNEETADCPLKSYEDCSTQLAVNALNLIRRQQQDIEVLKDSVNKLSVLADISSKTIVLIPQAKVVAIKDFTDHIIEVLKLRSQTRMCFSETDAMRIVKQLAGEKIDAYTAQMKEGADNEN